MITERYKQNLVIKGESIYKQIIDKLNKKYPKDYSVVIDPKSEEYFVGETFDDAISQAKKKYPRRIFFSAHIGWIKGKI